MNSLKEKLKRVWTKFGDWLVNNDKTIIIGLLITILFLCNSLYQNDIHYKEKIKLRTNIVALEIKLQHLDEAATMQFDMISRQATYIQELENKLHRATVIIQELLRQIKPPKEPIDPDKWTSTKRDTSSPTYTGM